METDRVEFGDGECVVTPATEADIKELNENLRDLDREEMQVFGCDYEDCKSADTAWAVRIGGDLVCICGTCPTTVGESYLSKHRFFFLMSTNKVWAHKFSYVKYSPIVARFVMNKLPPWVDTIRSMPIAKYTASIEWQKRILGFKEVDDVLVNGVRHIVLEKTKGDA